MLDEFLLQAFPVQFVVKVRSLLYSGAHEKCFIRVGSDFICK